MAREFFFTAILVLILGGCDRAIDETAPQAELPATQPDRLSMEDASARIRACIFHDSPRMISNAQFPLVEITTDEIWNRLNAQIFRVKEGPRAGQSFLIQGDRVVTLGQYVGGPGVMSTCVADLDGAGPTLIFTFAWGSGMHRSHIAAWRGGEAITLSPVVHWGGDMWLRRIDDQTVEVEYGRDGGKSEGVAGRLKAVAGEGNEPRVDLVVKDDLPKEVRDRLIKMKPTTRPSR